jgi:hypothetical protein
MLNRYMARNISAAVSKYLQFAIVLVGISGAGPECTFLRNTLEHL